MKVFIDFSSSFFLGANPFGGPTSTAPTTGTVGNPFMAGHQAPGGFGQPAATQQVPGGFGQPAAAQQAPGGFGQPAAAQQAPGGFGQPAAAQQAPGGFGQPATGFGQPVSAGGFGQPAATAAGFANFGQAPPASTAPGQFGMQNGGFNVAQQNSGGGSGWAAFGAGPPAGPPPTGAPPAYPGTQSGIPPQQAQGLGFGGAAMAGVAANQFAKPAQMGQSPFGNPAPQQQPQQFGAWPSQPAGNPFLVSHRFLCITF